jgi:trans-feruloyl-CoA hydratase/vanillin synthase
MADYETILIDRKNDVVIVTLNRPHKKNAMNPKLHHEMVELLGALRYDKDLGVLVITGKGDSFSAGEDLKEFFYEQRERSEFEALLDKSLEWRVRMLRSFPVPTIAMVNGWCFGGAFPSSPVATSPSPPTKRCSDSRKSTSVTSPAVR